MMYAMIMEKPREALKYTKVPIPTPKAHELLIQVEACGICRTDLHVLDGELTHPKLPLIPGHQIVGIIKDKGKQVEHFQIGQQVGVPWLGGSCGKCAFCLTGQENLCDQARFTGYQMDGGFAEYCVADHQFCFPIPKGYPAIQAAPLFCAGLIGYRALLKTQQAKSLGFYGFGSAAHILTQLALYQGKEVYAFTQKGDIKAQQFALQMGAAWAGNADDTPPQPLDAAIIFAPVGELVPTALKATRKGGIVVCGGIHMSDIPSFPYKLLWGERTLCSVANLTRQDGREFLALAPKVPIKTEVHSFPLNKANEALDDLRQGRFTGSAVIVMK